VHISRNCTGLCAVSVVLFAVGMVQAEPTLTVLEDWGTLSVSAWFEGYVGQPDSWSDRYEGAVLDDVAIEVHPSLVENMGSVWVTAQAGPAESGPNGVHALTSIEPVASGSAAPRGQASAAFSWRFEVGQEAAWFYASAEAMGGDVSSAGFTLVDVTDPANEAEVGSLEVVSRGSGLGGELLAGHVYTLDVFSESRATAGGDPYAVFQFSTNAAIVPQAQGAWVPEPGSLMVLVLGVGLCRRSSLRRRVLRDRDCIVSSCYKSS